MASSLLRKKLPLKFDVLLPFLRFEKELSKELLLSKNQVLFSNTFMTLTESAAQKPLWARDRLPGCELIPFKNKSEAVRILKSFKNLGVYFESGLNAKLAQALRKEVRELPMKRITYKVPSDFNFRYFAWSLFDDETLLVCSNPSSQFPLGWHEFLEDKNTPPNRAYLKIWELLCLNHIQLNPADVTIDLGSSPGGWSWALSRQVKKVYSIDKAPLDKKILADCPNIIYSSQDAFAVTPADFPDVTWLFSDIICTPQKLLQLVKHWQENSAVKNFACTIKFKGDCDFDILKEFRKFPNSTIIHLYQNKNEVTWIQQGNK